VETKIVEEFVKAINEHDVNSIGSLLTSDHTFTDAHNNVVKGKQQMLAGWKAYFDWFPDYKIEVKEIIAGSGAIALFGFAGGTFNTSSENKAKAHWRLPASWRAVVAGGKIAEWQVYGDTKIPYEIIEKFGGGKSEL
jgi:ketosteroid isomerase-like protein